MLHLKCGIHKCIFKILFGGYATPRKHEVFSRLALNSYLYFLQIITQQCYHAVSEILQLCNYWKQSAISLLVFTQRDATASDMSLWKFWNFSGYKVINWYRIFSEIALQFLDICLGAWLNHYHFYTFVQKTNCSWKQYYCLQII